MSLANLSLPDLIGSLVSFVLTLAVFSYILGDNALFRMSVHIFTGAGAGYAAVMAWTTIIWPQLFAPNDRRFPDRKIVCAISAFTQRGIALQGYAKFCAFGKPGCCISGCGGCSYCNRRRHHGHNNSAGTGLDLTYSKPALWGVMLNGFGQILLGLLVLFGTAVTLIYF